MSDTTETFARLRFLHESAHLLAVSSPQTSSHLEDQHRQLLLDHGLAAHPDRRRSVCNACGNIFMHAWTVKVSNEANRRRYGKSKHNQKETLLLQNGPTTLVYTCLRCGEKTRVVAGVKEKRAGRRAVPRASAVGNAHPAVNSESKLPSNISSTSRAPIQPTPASNVSNTSSKKRAKARKQGGLQAMLANSKASTDKSAGSGFGLDLMDLMHSG